MDSVETAQRVRRTRRDRRGQHNRRVLVQAALDWLLEDRGDVPGMAALCERAGVYHSAFYAHFKHVDECIAEAVREGFGRKLLRDMERWEHLQFERPDDTDQHRELIARTLRALLDERGLFAVIARSRHAPGALGVLERELRDQQIELYTQFLWKVALKWGVGAEHLRDFEAAARYLVEAYWTVAVDLVQGMGMDVEVEAARLARFGGHVVGGEIRRATALRLSKGS